MRDTWQISKADPLDYCESGISDGQFCFIRAMTTSLRSIGTTPHATCGAGFAWPLMRTFVDSTDMVPDPTISLRICVQREKMNEVDAEP